MQFFIHQNTNILNFYIKQKKAFKKIFFYYYLIIFFILLLNFFLNNRMEMNNEMHHFPPQIPLKTLDFKINTLHSKLCSVSTGNKTFLLNILCI